MPLLAGLQGVIDLLCVIHIYRTGRPTWWYFVVVGFPMIGALAYLIFEVIPMPDGRKIARRVIKTIDPSVDLKDRIREVERCGSVANRAALASELVNSAQFDDAIALYQSCLTGNHEDDLSLMFGLAEAYFHKRDADNAIRLLDRVIEREPWFRSGDAKLLRARALAGAKRGEEALAQYEAMLEHFSGEEARCRYASLLAAMGRLDMAEQALAAAEKRVSLAGSAYGRINREWLNGAREDIAAARNPA